MKIPRGGEAVRFTRLSRIEPLHPPGGGGRGGVRRRGLFGCTAPTVLAPGAAGMGRCTAAACRHT
jgi:hypothetical protein